MLDLSTYIYPFAFALTVSLIVTYFIIRVSRSLKLLTPIREERWHATPKPYLGGVAIWFAFILSTFVFSDFSASNAPVLIAASAMFVLGLLDDLLDLKAYIKFVYQIAIAAIIAKQGVTVSVFHEYPLISMAISILWIVLVTNAFNLIDNMDGLSSGIALISMLSFLVVSVLRGQTELIVPALVFSGAILGFLIFNFPPAKIFMGDSGALFMGFLIAVYSIQGTWHQATNLLLVMTTPVLLMGVALFDTMVVSVQRLLHGKPIYEGGKDHTSHRLVAHGWSEKQAVFILYGISLLCGGMAVAGFLFNAFVLSQIVLLLAVFLIVVGVFLSEAKVYNKDNATQDMPDMPDKPLELKRPYLLHKRRIIEVFIDTILIVVAYLTSYLLRFEGQISNYQWLIIQESLPIVLSIKLMMMTISGLYSGVWKYLEFDDFRKIFKANVFASVSCVVVLVWLYRFSGYSRSLFIIDFMMCSILITGVRVGLRMLRESIYGFPSSGKRAVIVGAGEAGQWVLHEIRKDKSLNIYPVGIVDDDRWKLGRKLYGVQVLGDLHRLTKVIRELAVEQVILAIPSLSEARRTEVLDICQRMDVPVQILEHIKHWSNQDLSHHC